MDLLWYVDPAVSGQLPPSQSPVAWFQVQPDDNSVHFCDSGNVSTDDGTEAGNVARQFMDGAFSFPDNTAVWDFEISLLGQLIRFPAALSSNATAQQYYNSRTGTVLRSLANARVMLHTASMPTLSEQTTIRQLYSQLAQKYDLLQQIDIQESIDTTTVDSVLQITKENLLQNCQTINDQIYVLLANSQNTRAAQIAAAQSYIANIQAATPLEMNYKTLLTLLAKKGSGFAWTDADLGQLRTIAGLCPADFGNAVYIARELLPSGEANRFPSEGGDPYCSEERSVTSDAFSAGITDAVIYPNPGNDMVFLKFIKAFSGNIQIISMDGQLKFKRDYQNALLIPFSVIDFTTGVYWIKCLENDETVIDKKLLITH